MPKKNNLLEKLERCSIEEAERMYEVMRFIKGLGSEEKQDLALAIKLLNYDNDCVRLREDYDDDDDDDDDDDYDDEEDYDEEEDYDDE